MRIYIDNCCLNRLFDDLAQARIRLESEAVKVILALCENSDNDYVLLVSPVSLVEIDKTPSPQRRMKLRLLVQWATNTGPLSEESKVRAREFEQRGLKPFDALHLAIAEEAAHLFMTVDDRLLKKAVGFEDLRIDVINPLRWLEEVLP